VCAHAQVAEIDAHLRNATPVKALARDFGVTRDSLMRHRDRHAQMQQPTVARNRNGRALRGAPPSAPAREIFLDSYRVTGNITESAAAAGTTRAAIFRWQEMDNDFALKFQQAEIEAVERLETEARERAVKGSKLIRRITRNGRLIEEVEEWRPSDAMLIKLLQALRPEKYGDKLSVTQTTVVKTVDSQAWEAV
jgi:hypothetical protein